MDKTPSNVSVSPTFKKLTLFGSRGRAGAVVAGSLGVGSLIFATNTVFLDWNKVILQAHRNKDAIEPAPKFQTLLDKVATDLRLSNSERKSVKLFTTHSQLVEVFGTVTFPCGVLLGIPKTANAECAADVTIDAEEENDIKSKKIRNKIEKLKEVSVLSDTAKLFIIAEGLLLAKEPLHFIVPALSASLATLTGLIQGALITTRTRLKLHPHANSIVYCFSLFLWLSVSVLVTELTRENQLREEMGHLSKEYIDGGVEFYEKLLENIHLKRDLFGEQIFFFFGSYYLEDLVSKRLSTLRKLQTEFTWLC